MKNLKIFTLLLIALTIAACSKDKKQNNVVTETVYNFQLVSIDIGQENFNQDEYTTEIGGIQVIIAKGLDDKLHFMIPGNLPEGTYDFQVNSIKRKYAVKKPILTETAENTIKPFRNYVNNLSPTLDSVSESVILANNINAFNNAFNELSIDQKNNLALFYKVNKNWFEFIMADDYTQNYNGRFTDNINTELKKSIVGVSIFTIGIVGVYYGDAEIKLLGIIACGLSWNTVIKSIKKIHTQGFKTINLMMDGEVSELDRGSLNSIEFQSETEKIISLNTQDRKIILSDANNATDKLLDFFNMYNKFNFWIDKANNIILSLNNLPFIHLSLFTKFQLPTVSPTLSNTMIPEIYTKINFSINNSNLNLQSVNFLNSQLKIKIKNSTNNEISDYLKYTFSDGFSTFSGKFPITVTPVNTRGDTIKYCYSGNTSTICYTSYIGTNPNGTGCATMTCKTSYNGYSIDIYTVNGNPVSGLVKAGTYTNITPTYTVVTCPNPGTVTGDLPPTCPCGTGSPSNQVTFTGNNFSTADGSITGYIDGNNVYITLDGTTYLMSRC